MNTRIIGLGNSILTDDGVGIYAVREVSRRLAEAGSGRRRGYCGNRSRRLCPHGIDDRLEADHSGGFHSIRWAGTRAPWSEFDPEDLHTSLRLRSVHDIDLADCP